MYHTFLDISFRKAGGDSFAESTEVIYAADQNILNAAVSQLIEDNQPELSRFMFANQHSQDIFAAVHIDPDDHIGSLIDNSDFLADFVVNGIHKHDGVCLFQRPILPFLNDGH